MASGHHDAPGTPFRAAPHRQSPDLVPHRGMTKAAAPYSQGKGLDYIGLDEALKPYRRLIARRSSHLRARLAETRRRRSLAGGASDWHLRYGLHAKGGRWIFREWLPNATDAWLVGDFSGWNRTDSFRLVRGADGDWEGSFPLEAMSSGQQYRLHVKWNGGEGQRIPSAASQIARSTPDLASGSVSFNAVVREDGRIPFNWRNPRPAKSDLQLIYEAHVGMAQERPGIGTFAEFQEKTLPRIAAAGYNTVQLMGIMQHPYYASFGYHVGCFFAVSELFGTPEDLCMLVDAAHGMNLRVTMDLVHSHAASNTVEGLSEMDGTPWLYFHDGPRGRHPAWGSRCFDYGKPQVLRFLLSNCRYWLECFNLDGFRFDGVTSMIFQDHGLGHSTWTYQDYFSPNSDWDALAYLAMANMLVKRIRPDATTIAEDVSDFPGMNAPLRQHGIGFDYRLAMGIPDFWFRLADMRDEDWPMGTLLYELTSRRKEERAISYVESHDQALVGGQSFFFRLAGSRIYNGMGIGDQSLEIDRAMALHKMARLATFATAQCGYLNFMGNEFGHPEWIDFPTERNGWSFMHARRQWSLQDEKGLRFHFLSDFDKAMLALPSCSPGMFTAFLENADPNDALKVLSFSRGDLLFVFNFHPCNSYTDFPVRCRPGEYGIALDSDAVCFGGFGRIAPGQAFFSRPSGGAHAVQVYIPSRTALVLRKKDAAQSAGRPPMS